MMGVAGVWVGRYCVNYGRDDIDRQWIDLCWYDMALPHTTNFFQWSVVPEDPAATLDRGLRGQHVPGTTVTLPGQFNVHRIPTASGTRGMPAWPCPLGYACVQLTQDADLDAHVACVRNRPPDKVAYPGGPDLLEYDGVGRAGYRPVDPFVPELLTEAIDSDVEFSDEDDDEAKPRSDLFSTAVGISRIGP